MPLQVRRGTDSQRQGITPALGELIFTTDTKKLYVGDGTTVGGNLISGGESSSAVWGSITGTLTLQTDLVNALNGKSNTGHTHTTGDIISGTFDIARIPTGTTPTTVSLGNHIHSIATTSTNGFMSSADKTKLNGVADGATANTGTVTSIIAGAGLNGGTISNSGTISANFGTLVDTICQGNDSRLSDERTPTDNSVSTNKLQNSSVTTDKINDAAITMAKIAQSGASANQVIKWNGTAWAPADDAVGTGTGSGAPTDAEYLTKSSNGGLSAERVVGDSTSVTANWATSGQVLFERAALTGDVTASANSNLTTIADNAITTNKINNGAVTFAKIEELTANSLLGNPTGSNGVMSPITCTAAGRALLDDADAAAQRTTLGAAAASHTHGNITNDGKLSNENRVVVTRAAGEIDTLAAGTTGTYLRQAETNPVFDSLRVGTSSGLPIKTGTGGALEAGAFGTSAGQFCEGNDARLSDSRTPTAHTHNLTDSYVGHIEAAANKVYRIDMYAATARTITDIRAQCGSGSCSAAIKNGSNTVGTVSVSTTSGVSSPSLSNTSVSANGTITLEISSNSDATDVWFVIRYTAATGDIS